MRFRRVAPFLEKQSEGKQRLSPDGFKPDPAPSCGKAVDKTGAWNSAGGGDGSETSVHILAFDDIE